MLVLCVSGGAAPAYREVTITYDLPPLLHPGNGRLIPSYTEDGLLFAPVDYHRLSLVNSGYSLFPDNGTAYLLSILGTVRFSS